MREGFLRLALLASLAVGLGWGNVCARAADPAAPADPAPVRGPTFEQIYANYRPDFLDRDRVARNNPHKLSLQPWFYNMAQVEQDYRVLALVKKGDELFKAKDYRGAMKLYREVIGNFPNDLWRIQANGIFVPSSLYCQRQLLRMPEEEILFYRTLYDTEAKNIFERARKYYSLLDFAELAERYLATSYGDDALWELGNAALDQGEHAKALFYFRQIEDYCTLSDIPRDQLTLRLATCYRHLGMEKEWAEARGRLTTAALKTADGTVRADAFLRQLEAVKAARPAAFSQVRDPSAVSLGDYRLFPDLKVPVERDDYVWSEPQPNPGFQWYVRDQPWVYGNYVYTLHLNVLLCRSLLTGKLIWAYGPGGLVDWFDTSGIRKEPWGAFGGAGSAGFTPESDLLIHDGLVFASILKEGPSLVAVDRVTGQPRWTRGAIGADDDVGRNTRYLAAPAPGPNVVYAPFVREDIEGKTHLTSVVGVQCLDSRTGRLIWSRDICLLTPPKFSTSMRIRRLRIYGASPVVRDGVVYCTTNAGFIAALDALSGGVLWATRYPHSASIHDLLKGHDKVWYARPPLLLDKRRLLVTPVDSDRLLCLDPASGKVRWSIGRGPMQTLVGIAPDGNVVLTGSGFNNQLMAVNPADGSTVWRRDATPRDCTSPIGAAAVACRPILTESGRLYFNAVSYGGVFSEQYWDIAAKKTLAQRWWYYPGVLGKYNEEISRAARNKGEEPDTSKFLSENTERFTTYHRMSFRRFGTQFELEVSPQRMSMWYDLKAVASSVAGDNSPQGLYSRAELAEIDGDRVGAVALYQQALAALPVWPTPFRTEINRQLFRLYNRQAESAIRAGDLKGAEQLCYRMSSACTTSDDEIHTILAMAEVFGKQKRWSDSAACLMAAIRHYRDVKTGVPAILAGDTTTLRATGKALLANLHGKSPHDYYAGHFALAVACMETALPDYFSVLSPLPKEVDVQTGQFATTWLRRLAGEAPEDFRRQREQQAAAALASESDESTVLKLLGEYPGTAAAQGALDRLIARAHKLPEPDRRIDLWRLNDAARLNGLTVPDDVARACNIAVPPVVPAALASAYRPAGPAAATLPYDPNTLLRLLTPAGEKAVNLPLAFVGMRSKRRYANKFSVLCWDLATNAKKWEVADIRLKDKGEEEGFTKYFVHDDHVIVCGWFDVLALSLADGKIAWRFQTPYGFRIIESASAEDLMVLSDSTRTIAIHLRTGQLVWEANETGGVYSPPYLRDNLLVTVRRNPSGVAFRDLGTGRLLGHLQMPALSESIGNPAVDWAAEGVPLAQAGDSLVITDGWDTICIDIDRRKVRWQRRIADIDRGGNDQPSFRMWANDKVVVVLKPEYDSLGLECIDLASGRLLWHVSENKTPGVLYNAVIGPERIAGLCFDANDSTAVTAVGYNLADGKRLFKKADRGLQEPRAWIDDPLFRGQCFPVLVSDEQKRIVLLVDSTTGKTVSRHELVGYGLWGGYGEVSCVAQGRRLVVLSDKDLTVLDPKE